MSSSTHDEPVVATDEPRIVRLPSENRMVKHWSSALRSGVPAVHVHGSIKLYAQMTT